MATFLINGKEYELKLDWKAVKYLNGLYEGGSFELIGKAMMGDLETFPRIVHAALFHTGENFALETVEQAIGEAIAEERLDMTGVLRMSNEIVNDSFFYKATVAKLLAKDKKAKTAIDELLK